MTWDQILGLFLALLVMSVGLLGSFLPALPGAPLVLAAAIGHKLWFGEASVRGWVLALLVVLALLSFALDYLATVLGARQLGATRRGMIGAVVGALGGLIVGAFFGGVGSIVGILVGPFAGATLLERTGARPWREAARAGLGAALGVVAGAFGKFLCCLLMVLLFAVDVLIRSFSQA